ncbi:bifunctional folylpolyglutamate synthase/dihydrofolate synthase [Ligilactobacillus ceti]|uniref:Dihydrofolate synthase/folylpolyglutamate synthase n=1 Tax=Ligilactobacillus ceti DSM 22408 TaxID=1122146 RepID=A0A0R2KHW3_9LACO|nr:folylpolyglutamate synthase/dihydrofolate synthase family protein [Ligilactobacillus ceti]KRN88979.1 folylpolyglutamate synthase [Ligilactobacillus ceti DSM 22408]
MITNYQQALEFIHGRHKFKKAPTLARMNLFLDLLGRPDKHLAMIHITGTNGKGSTLTYLSTTLQEQGYNVGTFTSPYLVRFNDRIQYNNVMIPDDELVTLVQKIQPIVQQLDQDLALTGGGPTEFEIVTAVMFLYFAKKDIDYLLVEVGIGGTYDSTNVIHPILSIITNVAYDHQNLLGGTLTEIAQQKVGIIKEQVPVIVGDVTSDVKQVIIQQAQKMKAQPLFYRDDFGIELQQTSNLWGEKFNFSNQKVNIHDLQIGLLGEHQVKNAAVAIQAYLTLFPQITSETKKIIKQGLAKAQWPGRFEMLNADPLIVVDGAHNEAGLTSLQALLEHKFAQKEVYLICAVLADKDNLQSLCALAQNPKHHVMITNFDGPRLVSDPIELSRKIKNSQAYETWQTALLAALQTMNADDLLVFTGSLYFVSEVRAYFKEQGENENGN